MNNQETVAHSGERLSFFQLFSEKKLNVEIPIIQRDYAQGRHNQSTVRTDFLDALHDYLEEGRSSRDLDFVYGSVLENVNRDNPKDDEPLGRFVPLDGQQRLTTLFLLHWYLAQISSNAELLRSILTTQGRSRFTYETRSSSREFCDALMRHDIDFGALLKNTKGRESVANTIHDKGWFYLSWASDPTISSMLTMLNDIHDKFAGHPEYFDRLIDPEEPVITFLFLNLQEFKLTDDLYIKMNARGKPLSNFENFKAQLEKKIKAFDGEWPEYTMPPRVNTVSGYEYFIHKIDTDWADVFWAYRNVATEDNTYDVELMNFIFLVIANFHLLSSDVESDDWTEIRDQIFGERSRLKKLSFKEFENLGCLSQSSLMHLISMFDLLHHNDVSAECLTSYLSENGYYSEESIFEKVIKNETSYAEKVRFYAFYVGLDCGWRDEQLLNWMRVVFNLTENTIINTGDEYQRALRAIHALIQAKAPILELLKKNVKVQGFTEVQVVEERIKAHLMGRSYEWRDLILEVEAHGYFKGQIGFMLKFSGIVDYYLDHENTDWGDADQLYFDSFKRYSEAASAVFETIESNSGVIDYAWERAVLSKGDYMTPATAERFNLLSSRQVKNNIDRDHSWRRLLRLPATNDTLWNERQGFVKAVFDDSDFSVEDVQGSLEKICTKALDALSVDDWRRSLIQNPELLQICKQGFMVKNDHEIILLHESKRNHTHSELYSKSLELKMLAKQVDAKPFEYVSYRDAKGRGGWAFVWFEGFYYNEHCYEMKVGYKSGRYEFRLLDQENSLNVWPVHEMLTDFGFVENDGADEGRRGYQYGVDGGDDALECLASLCGKFRALIDE